MTRSRPSWRGWPLAVVLFLATFASTMWVGAGMAAGADGGPAAYWEGWTFAVPLMAILLAHEFGHYIAARIHGVDVSPPYFIPAPVVLLGTMGAIIRMRGSIRSRNALFDIGAAGPLAGFAVALPVLVFGIASSPVQALPSETGNLILEGRSLLYTLLLYALKGPIPNRADIMLNPTAFAGWAGMLVTMINLIPVGQLDGGHVAYALLGPRQDRVSEHVRKALPVLGLAVCSAVGLSAYAKGIRGDALWSEFSAGAPWIVWALVLSLLAHASGRNHPPTEDKLLSPLRRVLAVGTLMLFVFLFMPWWIRMG